MINRKDLTKYIFAFTLGDGALFNNKQNLKNNGIGRYANNTPIKNSHYYLKQIAIHKDYVDWQANILESLTNVSIYYTDAYTDKRGYSCKAQYKLQTRAHPFYTTMRERIYPSGIKTISMHDLKLLDWETLAIFYMDDGWIESRVNKNGSVYYRIGIASHSFTQAENYILTAAIKEKTGVRFETTKHKQNSGQYKYYIRTSKQEAIKFLEGVRPYILPSFEYKLIERLAPTKGDDIV